MNQKELKRFLRNVTNFWQIITGQRAHVLVQGPRAKPQNLANIYMQSIGGSQKRLIWTESKAPGAGKTSLVDAIYAIGSTLITLDPTEDNTYLVIDSAIFTMKADSTVPFLVTPFLTQMENGEDITTTSEDESDPLLAIDNAIIGTHQVKLGELMIGHPYRSNGTLYYSTTEVAFDITKECWNFIQEYYQKTVDEQNVNVLKLGIHELVTTIATSVTYFWTLIINYHFVNASVGGF
jgi:hypothetical protein